MPHPPPPPAPPARSSLGLGLAALAGAALAAAAYAGAFLALLPRAAVPPPKEALLLLAPGPRLIVDSGSSALHGLDATALGRATNRVGVNAADSGIVPLAHRARRLAAAARPGDAVVLPMEWLAYRWPDRISDRYVAIAATTFPLYLRSLPLVEQVRLLASIPLGEGARLMQANWNAWRAPPDDAHRRELRRRLGGEGWDGGFVREAGQSPAPPTGEACRDYLFPGADWLATPPDAAALAAALAPLRALRDRGVAVAFLPPLVAGEGCYPPGADAWFASVRAALAAAGLPLLGDPRALLFPPEAAYDTPYHLLPAFRPAATATVSAWLLEAGLTAPGPPPPPLATLLDRLGPEREAAR